MPANSTHPDYDASAAEWLRARDVLAGEDAVKAGGERYLPRLDSQTDEEFLAYRKRASFFNATSRTKYSRRDLLRAHLWLFLAAQAALKGEIDIDSRLTRYEPLLSKLATQMPPLPPILERGSATESQGGANS